MKAITTYLSAGHIGAFIKLFPVVSWLVKERRELAVIRQIPTHERLGIAFAKTNVALCKAVNKNLASIRERGLFDALRRKWLPESDKD
ncbi:MAG TPA: transporter substrate-binding domain-containing protein [Rubrobacter sp.]|nr:transporter substrate-binding domain-containing protein [Rubrobacter sp.]